MRIGALGTLHEIGCLCVSNKVMGAGEERGFSGSQFGAIPFSPAEAGRDVCPPNG